MQYISPFHFIDEDVFRYGIVDANKLQSIQYDLLSKIDSSDTKSIFIANKELYKNDILQIFDRLENPELFNIHTQIYKDKLLLQFLEDNVFVAGFNATFNPYLSNANAIAFISPYYKNSSIKVLTKAIEQKDEIGILKYFAVSHLLTKQDELEVNNAISNALQTPIEDIINNVTYIKDNDSLTDNKLDELALINLTKLYNSFPVVYDSSREKLADAFNRLGCVSTHHSYYDYASTVFNAALTINTSANTRNQLTKNLGVVTNKKNEINKKSKKQNDSKTWILPVVVVVLIVIRVIYGFWQLGNDKSGEVALNSFKTNSSVYDTAALRHRYDSVAKSTSSNTSTSTESISTTETAEPLDYTPFSYSNTSFDDFMTLLYNQSIMFSPTDKKQIVFKTGDNIYESLFDSPAFIVPNTRVIKGRTLSDKTKNVKVMNNTSFECILVIRNTVLAVPVAFDSKYIPAKSSFNLQLKEGYTDIRPYLGNKLVVNKFYNRASITERAINLDYIPPYLFESVPRKNKLLFGIGVVFDDIKDTNAKISIEQINGELVQNIDELKK